MSRPDLAVVGWGDSLRGEQRAKGQESLSTMRTTAMGGVRRPGWPEAWSHRKRKPWTQHQNSSEWVAAASCFGRSGFLILVVLCTTTTKEHSSYGTAVTSKRRSG